MQLRGYGYGRVMATMGRDQDRREALNKSSETGGFVQGFLGAGRSCMPSGY